MIETSHLKEFSELLKSQLWSKCLLREVLWFGFSYICRKSLGIKLNVVITGTKDGQSNARLFFCDRNNVLKYLRIGALK